MGEKGRPTITSFIRPLLLPLAAAAVLIGVAIFVSNLSTPAHSQPTIEACVSPASDLSESLDAARAAGMTVTSYTGSAYTAVLNAMVQRFGPPPPQYLEYDAVFTAVKDSMDGNINIGFATGQCLMHVITMPVDDWASILERAFRKS